MTDPKKTEPHAENTEAVSPDLAYPEVTAHQTYQNWLDDVAHALWHGDFEAVANAMHYPHVMATTDAELTFHTHDEIIIGARDFRERLLSIGAQAYHRICNWAEFRAPDQIFGHHMTYVLRGGQYVLEPFANELTLVQHGGGWLGAGIRAAVVNARVPILSPDQLRQRRESRKRKS